MYQGNEIAQTKRCAIKLVLAQEGMGQYSDFFQNAGYDIVDMYKKYSEAEIDYILDVVERKNDILFEPSDRVVLWKLFRYRHFTDPGRRKPFKNIDTIPAISISKATSRAPDDADLDLKLMDSDRRRQIKRIPQYDEQAGMVMVQLER